MVYLLGVMVTAVYYERAVSIAAALLSFLAFDFFFVPPTLTLQFGSTRYLITALVLLIVGLVTSALASRVRREAQSAAQAEIAANDERIRSSLLASLSHDLRTPLAVIAGSASSLRENRERMSLEQQNQLLETIYQRSVSMSTEVSDLLEMTRLHTGRVHARSTVVSARGAGRCGARTMSKRHRCTCRISRVAAGDVPLARGRRLIEKLFVNLIENAALHTPADTADSRLLEPASKICWWLRSEIRGPGLPPGTEELIFEKFERGARTGLSSGSGLGLSICRAIADLHGACGHGAQPAEKAGQSSRVRFPVERPSQMPVNA